MIIPQIEELPIKFYRLTFPNKGVYDVFIQDPTDTSTCLNITDEQGDLVPYPYWDDILVFLNTQTI